MKQYNELIAENMPTARKLCAALDPYKSGLGYLFVTLDGTPIAAFIRDGRDSVALFSRHDVRKGEKPEWRDAHSADAYDALLADVMRKDSGRKL
jgi:hypothetical protein